MDCEFCYEIKDLENSRFKSIYNSFEVSRIVAQKGLFIAMPTLGQLIRYSLLVLPTQHYERMASLPEKWFDVLENFIYELGAKISSNSNFIVLEHGANNKSNTGCGIYHAHFLIIPLPNKKIDIDLILPDNPELGTFNKYPSIKNALFSLKSTEDYLIASNMNGHTNCIIPYDSFAYPSQYFRRQLVNLLKLDKEWDWRLYNEHEPYLIDTLNLFK